MAEAGTPALRDAFAEELRAQGVVLPQDERELILSLCVSRYLADSDRARSA
jgi:hypothetical protein